MKEIGIEVLRGYAKDFEEIKDRGWEKFTLRSKVIVLTMVREFYANVKESEGDFVFVLGKRGTFNLTAINNFSNLN